MMWVNKFNEVIYTWVYFNRNILYWRFCGVCVFISHGLKRYLYSPNGVNDELQWRFYKLPVVHGAVHKLLCHHNQLTAMV